MQHQLMRGLDLELGSCALRTTAGVPNSRPTAPTM